MDVLIIIGPIALSVAATYLLTRAFYRVGLDAERIARLGAEREAASAQRALDLILARTPDGTELAHAMADHAERIVDGMGRAIWPAAGPMVETPLTEAADSDDDSDYDDPRFAFDDVELGRDDETMALRTRHLPVEPPADTDLNVDWMGA